LKPDMIHLYGLYDLSLLEYLYRVTFTGFGSLILWYLWCLCLCYMVAWCLERLRGIGMGFTVLWIGVIIVLNLIPIDLFGVFTLKWYGIFFIIGYALHYYNEKYYMKWFKRVALLSLAAFPLCAYLFNWMIPYQDADYGTIGLGALTPALLAGEYKLMGVMVLMALLGTGFVYSAAKVIRLKPLAYLGTASIGVYLLHIMFVGLFDNYWVSALVALVISLALYEVGRRIWITVGGVQ
jgi:hypothetical protein